MLPSPPNQTIIARVAQTKSSDKTGSEWRVDGLLVRDNGVVPSASNVRRISNSLLVTTVATDDYLAIKSPAAVSFLDKIKEESKQSPYTSSQTHAREHEFKSRASQVLHGLPEQHPRPLQELRDEVRFMVASGQPKTGTPLYQGRKRDGDPVTFLKKYYKEYLPSDGYHTLYLHDMRKIDPTLVTALENDRKRMEAFPLGTKSDLLSAITKGVFTDGHGSGKRVQDAQRMRNIRVNTNISTSQ